MWAMDSAVARWCKTTEVGLIGRRIRSARKQRGLTLAQLGEGVVSVPYLSRVENGQRRADAEVLAALSSRLEVPLAELVAPGEDETAAVPGALQLELDYAELALASGDLADAEGRIATLATDDDVDAHPGALRQVRRLRAGLLEAQADLRGAVEVLGELVQAGPHDVAWLRDLIALSRCRRDAGDFELAARVEADAAPLIAAAELAGTTEAVQLALTVATARAEMGEVAAALELCRDAIRRADALDSPRALASAYWNASIYESQQGNSAAALPLARRALAEFERGDDARNLGRLRTLVGQLMLRLDSPPLEEALGVLQQARRELEWSSAGVMELARNDLCLARALFRSGDDRQAQVHLEAALPVLEQASPTLYADALVLQGQVAFSRRDRETARVRYQQAAAILTGVGGDRTVGELWYELAALLESVGDQTGALGAYRSAAASAGFGVRPFGAAARAAAPNVGVSERAD